MNHTKFIAAALLLAASTSTVLAEDMRDGIDDSPSAAAMAFDLVIIRPLGLVATVAGVGLAVLHFPLSIIQGEPPRQPIDKFIVEPARYTFVRPLGEMQ